MAEVQALLNDHVECGKHTAADVVTRAQAVLSESELLRAMFDVGYFPAEHTTIVALPALSLCHTMMSHPSRELGVLL